MSQIKIERGVPLPPKYKRVYPWDDLKVGESFVVETRSSGRSLVDNANKSKPPKVFETHVTDGQTRIWRIK